MEKKSFFLTIALVLCTITVFSQSAETPYTGTKEQQEGKPVVFRDRLIMDIYQSFWMGMPTQVNHMKFDPGFNVSALWDFKIKNKPLAVGLGVGVTYNTQYSNALLQYNSTEDVMRYQVLPDVVHYNLLKMNYLTCNIPLEFRYRNPNGFKFTVGAKVGLVCEVSQKYKGEDPMLASDTMLYKNLHFVNKSKYHVDVFTRIGWKFVDVYYNFQFTPLFTTGKGPKIYPMSVGISLSIF